MRIVDVVEFWLWPTLSQNHGTHESRQHLGEAKTAVEPVHCFGEVAPRVLGLAQGVAATADGALDIAHDYIHPACALDLGRSPSSFSCKLGMCMIQCDEAAKAAQPIAEDLGMGARRRVP